MKASNDLDATDSNYASLKHAIQNHNFLKESDIIICTHGLGSLCKHNSILNLDPFCLNVNNDSEVSIISVQRRISL